MKEQHILQEMTAGNHAADAFVYESKTKSLQASFQDTPIFEKNEISENSGYSVRVFGKDSFGFSYSSGLDFSNAAEIMGNAGADLLARGDKPKDIGVDFCSLPEFSDFRGEYERLSIEDLQALAHTIFGKITGRKFVSSIPYLDIGVHRLNKTIIYKGNVLEKGYDFAQIFLYIKAESNGEVQNDGWSMVKKELSEINTGELVEKAYERTISKFDAGHIDSASLPVVFDKSVMSDILDVLIDMLVFDNIQKKKSPFFDKLHSIISSEKLNLLLSTEGDVLYKAPFDDEGVAHKQLKIINNGVLTDFLYDSFTAYRNGRKGNGFGFRAAYTGAARAGATNIIINNGTTAKSDILKDNKRLVWIDNLIGLHTIDMVTGAFSLGFEGRYYENGKFVKALNGMTVAGTIQQLLNNYENSLDDGEAMGRIYTPSAFFRDIVIGG